MFNDLREFIEKAGELGESKVVEGADAHLEIGAITHLLGETLKSPLLIFDKIKGYEAGYRVVSNLFTSQRRISLALGLPLEAGGIELVRAYRDKLASGITPLPPIEVDTGPVKENILTGDDVDLLKFPAPKWHELDGGPYIGTGSMTISRDPDEGWVNVACYRVQVYDKNTCGIMLAPSHHLEMIQKKYWSKGSGCPIAVTCGQEPVTWLAAISPAAWGFCEYDYAGWWRGKPVEVIKGVTTGLPIPATAEIVLEGEIMPPEVEMRPEGPFGEWCGYYATSSIQRPVFKVKSILYRNNPIIQGNPPSRFPAVWSLGRHIQRAATVWSELDRQIPGVKGVWVMEEANAVNMLVISLKQEYPGHAKQAAMIAAGTQMAARSLHYLIVVDDDIDPSNTGEVLWALATRGEPADAIDITRWQVSSFLDPTISLEKRSRGDSTTSLATILACKPYHWIKQFPIAIGVSPEQAKQVKEKWQELFS